MSDRDPEAHEQGLSIQAHDDAVAKQIGQAWKELRRGAAMATVKDHLFGQGDDALEPGQYDTLELLVQRDAWRMSDLADALRVDPSTATRAVQRLLRTGLAERRASQADGRVVMVSATVAGAQRYDAIADRRKQFLRSVLAPFDTDERAELAELLDRLVSSLDDVARCVGPPSPPRPS